MALADSMLKYGMKKIKMSQASNLGNTLSKVGDLGMEAGAALSKVGKATETNRQSNETIQAGKKQVGIDDKGSFLERTGLKSSLSSDKTFDVKRDEGGINPRKVSYDMQGLKQVGTLSSTYNNDYLVDKYGKDWEDKHGVSTNITTPLEYREKTENFNPISQDTVNVTMASYDSRAKALEAESVPKGPDAPINPNTGERFMTVEEGDDWDIKNKEHMQKHENKVRAGKAKTGEELGNKLAIAEQEGYANNLSIKSKNKAEYENAINKDKPVEGSPANNKSLAKPKSPEDLIIDEFVEDESKGINGVGLEEPAKKGSGSTVSKRQQLLVDAGFDIGSSGKDKNGVDGVDGKKTKTAWDLYQKEMVDTDVAKWKTLK